MPVSTRSNLPTSETSRGQPEVNNNMAAKPKELTLQDVINTINNLENKLNAKIENQIAELQKTQKDASKDIKSQLDNIEKSMNDQSDTVTNLQAQCETQKKIIKKLETRVESLEIKQRSHNMIIEGLRETNGENLRSIIDELLEDLGMSFTVEWVDTIYRMGPKRQGTNKRPIMLTFPFISYKHEILRNIYKLKNDEKWRGVFLQDDMTPDEQKKRKETRAIYAYAKAKGLDVKMKGSRLVVDGVKYNHNEELPHNLSIENAKTIQVQDGIAFQGPHAIYSNLHHCNFTFEKRKHKSSEQALQYKRAEICKQQHVAKQIMETDDSYEAMNLGKKLGENEEWKKDCITYLRPILKEKFDQNPELKRKLKASKGHLYEATTHPVFGAGLTLAQSTQICQQNTTAGNQLGIELERLRDYYIQSETQQDGGEGGEG